MLATSSPGGYMQDWYIIPLQHIYCNGYESLYFNVILLEVRGELSHVLNQIT